MTIHPTLHCECGGRFLHPAFGYEAPPEGETSFDLGSQAYNRCYDRCAVCLHWFGRHDIDLSRLYESDYVTATYGGPEGLRRRFEAVMALPKDRSDNAERVARVCGFAESHGIRLETGPRLLDVGAGLGVFPAAAKRAGWRVLALDLDPRMVAHMRSVAEVEAETIDLFQLDPEGVGSFAAITFNKVLEHIEDPVVMLSRSAEFLAPNGFVYIEVPDVAAAVDGPGREEFFIEHHHVFSTASLAIIAERAEYMVRSINSMREPSGKYTLAAFLVKANGLVRK